tara:strand:- start:1661 stop:2470 length:810 start_codon:yes stop_codon:yes gene_type:complete
MSGFQKKSSLLKESNIPGPHGALTLDRISVSYRRRVALQDISGSFQPGSLTAVVGPNGGGKSTLLKAVLGLVPTESGKIICDHFNHRDIAYLPQQSEIDRLFPLTVGDVVGLGLCYQEGFFRRIGLRSYKRIARALKEVGMTRCFNRSLHTLSGGQFQRVLFARLSLQQAPVILLDEPFAAVDSYTIDDLIQIILGWQKQGRTIVVVSHDMDLVREFFPETLLLVNKCLAWGKTSEVATLENFRLAKRLFRDRECQDVELNVSSGQQKV